MYPCETAGRGVRLTTMATGRNYSSYTLIHSQSQKLQNTLNGTFGIVNLTRCKTGKTALIYVKEVSYEIFYSTDWVKKSQESPHLLLPG